MFKDRTYQLTMVKVDIRRFETNQKILSKIVYPGSFSFVSIIVSRKTSFRKIKGLKLNKNHSSVYFFHFPTVYTDQELNEYLRNRKVQNIVEKVLKKAIQ